jgi:Tfp pilus assembly protein PilN
MRFDINLASRPFQDTRTIIVRWGAVLGGVICITAALLFISYQNWHKTRDINRSMAQVQQQIEQLDQLKKSNEDLLNQPVNRDTRQRSQFVNGIIVRKSFSWTRAFSDLENIMPSRVHLLKIEPELTPDNQLKIKMTVAGNSRDKALDLVRKLETSSEFKHPAIERETTKTNSGGGGDPLGSVEFDITAVYVPPPPRSKPFAGKEPGEGE